MIYRLSAPSEPRIPEIDFLRGAAVLLILTQAYFTSAHGAAPGTFDAYLQAVAAFAWCGVDLLFVTSGFLIGGILIDRVGAGRFLSIFYGRRFVRILPLYAVVTVLFYLSFDHAGPWLFASAAPPLAYATFTQNFWMASAGHTGAPWMGATWSLAVGAQLYAILPLVVRCIPPQHLRAVMIGCVAAAPLIRAVCYFGLPSGHIAAQMLLPCRMDAFAVGVVLAIQLRSGLQPSKVLLLAGIVGALSAMAALTLARVSINSIHVAVVGYSLVAALWGAVLAYCVYFRPQWSSLGPIRWLGTRAYFVLLCHMPVLGFIAGSPPSLDIGPVLAVATLLIAADLSWRFFELPLIRLGRSPTGGLKRTTSDNSSTAGVGNSDAGAVRATALPFALICVAVGVIYASSLDFRSGQRVVTFGTSLTVGGLWQGQLRDHLNRCTPVPTRILIHGKSGEASDWGIKNLHRVIRERPDVVVIEFAINDASQARNVSLRDSRANTIGMIEALRTNLPRVRVILMTTNHAIDDPSRTNLSEYYAQYLMIARELAVEVIDLHPAWRRATDTGGWQRLIPDKLHPAKEAYDKVAIPAIAEVILGRPCK